MRIPIRAADRSEVPDWNHCISMRHSLINKAEISSDEGIVHEKIAEKVADLGGQSGVQQTGNMDFGIAPADVEQFQAALDRRIAAPEFGAATDSDKKSLGSVLGDRVTGLASEFAKDQQYVSKLLEKATRTGDSMHLMRAMMALHDYQLRVQTMSKTVSKAASSIDQLTKLQ
jgi:hypothetical protein